jgi:hypothetical protein
MSTELSSTIQLSLGFTQSETLNGYSNNLNGSFFLQETLNNGSGESQASQVYSYEATLAPSGEYTSSLAALTIELSFGASGVIDMNQVRLYAIQNTNTGSGEVLHVGGGTTPWLDFYESSTVSGVAPVEILGPGDAIIRTNFIEGFNISANNIRVYNPNNVDVEFQILILGSNR